MDGLLYVRKPEDWTSFDVVAKIRKLYHVGCGHTGTLDPKATGVLIVMLGKACKANPYLVGDKKEYVARLALGKKYDTGDIWGRQIEEKPVSSLDDQMVKAVFKELLGKQLQLPPMYSAVKKNGKKLMDYAREGKTVEREPREIEIFELELIENQKDITFRAVVSSGTYIRVLCETIAEKLGTVGAMAGLVRTRLGSVSLEDCLTLKEIIEKKPAPLPLLDGLTKRYRTIELSSQQAADIRNGKRLQLQQTEPLVLLVYQNEAIAMAEHVENGWYRSKRGLW